MVQIPAVTPSPFNYPNNKAVFSSYQFTHSVKIEAGDVLSLGSPVVQDVEVPSVLYTPERPCIITQLDFHQTGVEALVTTVFIYSFLDNNYYCIGALRGSTSSSFAQPVDSLAPKMPPLLVRDDATLRRGLKLQVGETLYYGISQAMDNDGHIVLKGRTYQDITR